MKVAVWTDRIISRLASFFKSRWAEICADFAEPEDLAAPFDMPHCCKNPSHQLKSLLRQACDLLSEERDEIFASHQVGGVIVVTDVFSAHAAQRVKEIDDLIKAAAVVINATEGAA